MEVPLGDARVRIAVRNGQVSVEGLPDSVQVTTEGCQRGDPDRP